MSHLYKRREVYYIKYYENGRAHYKSLKTKSKKRAEAIQREIDSALWEWFDFDAKLITVQSSEAFVVKDTQENICRAATFFESQRSSLVY